MSSRNGGYIIGAECGYLSAWPEKFVAWSELMGTHITSHDMRHTWAQSMLSGTWGYLPQDITFVSRQLGHFDIGTTQRAYGHWDPGAGLATARLLRGEVQAQAPIITAEALLNAKERLPDEVDPVSPGFSPLRQETPSNSTIWVSNGN